MVGVGESARWQPPHVDRLGPVQPRKGFQIFLSVLPVTLKHLSVRDRELLSLLYLAPSAATSIVAAVAEVVVAIAAAPGS